MISLFKKFTVGNPCSKQFLQLKYIQQIVIILFISFSSLSFGSQHADGWYKVQSGDYLGKIATFSGVTIKDIKKANKIKGSIIHAGEKLSIPKPMRNIKGQKIRWQKPHNIATPKLLRTFGEHRPQKGLTLVNTGTDIVAPIGSSIKVPADGVVRYIGNQDGFGTIIIIEHGAKYSTVLGPFNPNTCTVSKDQMVHRGVFLGKTGSPVVGNKPYLHVELRKNNKSINPARILK